MTPNFAVVSVDYPHWPHFRVWVPLFLLWIPLLLLSPLIFVVLVGLCVVGRIGVWRAIAMLWEIACSLPGTHVQVRSEGNQVTVRIL